MADYPKAGQFDAPAYDLRRGGPAPRPNTSLTPPRLPQPRTAQQKLAAGPRGLQQQERELRQCNGAPQANSFVRPPAVASAGTRLRPNPGSLSPLKSDAMATDTLGYEEYKEHSGTRFFEKKVSIFKAWQLFIMWMAVCGLTVYVASYIGFRHMLKPNSRETTTTFRPLPEPGFLGGRCDAFTPCEDPAICVQDICVCKQGTRVVDNVCTPVEEARISSVVWNWTNDIAPSNAQENFEISYKEFPTASVSAMSPEVPASFEEELSTPLVQDAAQYSRMVSLVVASNFNETNRTLKINEGAIIDYTSYVPDADETST